jgi:hypothetical protein
MASVLEDYSDEIIKYATDVKTGIQRKCKWPPTISEVVEFCDAERDHARKIERFNNWGKETLAERLAIDAPREIKPTMAEMKAKYGENWGITNLGSGRSGKQAEPAPSWDEIVPMYQNDPSRMERLTGPFMTRRGEAAPTRVHHPSIAVPPGDNILPFSKNHNDDYVANGTALPMDKAA